MRILLGTHHLHNYAGSEIYTATLARGLQAAGHDVAIYTRHPGTVAGEIAGAGVPVVDDLSALARERFDVAHVHHNVVAIEVRAMFPALPMLFLAHGVLPFLEQPPPWISALCSLRQ